MPQIDTNTEELTAEDYKEILLALQNRSDKLGKLTSVRAGRTYDKVSMVTYKVRRMLRERKEQEDRDAQARQRREIERMADEISIAGGFDESKAVHPRHERRA